MIQVYGMKMDSLDKLNLIPDNMEKAPFFQGFWFRDMGSGRTFTLAPEHWGRIMKGRTQEVQKRSLMGCLLAVRALYDKTGETNLPPYRFSRMGKPELADFPDFYFNVSHSGEYALCAYSGHPVGVDVQQVKEISPAVPERFFTEGEKETLRLAGAEWGTCFCRIWAAKEAYVKYSGIGLSKGLHTFEADLIRGVIKELGANGGITAFTELLLPGDPEYCAAVCGGRCNPVVRIQEISREV